MIEKIEDINTENLEELTPEELVDLKVSLEEMIDEIDDFLENYRDYNNYDEE